MSNSMAPIIGLVANVGFPIAVSIYLLVRIESKLDSLTLSIYELAKAVDNIDGNASS